MLASASDRLIVIYTGIDWFQSQRHLISWCFMFLVESSDCWITATDMSKIKREWIHPNLTEIYDMEWSPNSECLVVGAIDSKVCCFLVKFLHIHFHFTLLHFLLLFLGRNISTWLKRHYDVDRSHELCARCGVGSSQRGCGDSVGWSIHENFSSAFIYFLLYLFLLLWR